MTEKPTNPHPKDSHPENFEFPPLDTGPSAGPGQKGATPSGAGATERPLVSDTELEQPVSRAKKSHSWFMAHKTTGLTLVVAVVGLGMWGINKIRHPQIDDQTTEPTTTSDVIPVNAVEVRMGRVQDEINAVGTLKGEVEIELRFEVDGTIHEFRFVDGAKVRKGDIIARLNDRDAKLKVQRASIELQQTVKLYELGGVSKTKLDEAKLNLDVAQSELDKTRIVASRDGILGDKSADVGEFVTPQRKLATLVAIKNVIVTVGVIEKQVDKVFPGQKILVTVDAFPGNVFEGTIASISPIVTGGAKTIELTAKIPNPDSLLLPGMFARTRIITHERDDAISIPNDALVKTAGGFQVFIVNQQTNTAEARDVDVSYVATEFSEIGSGLNAGEVVIVQKPPELKAGSKVKIIDILKAGG